VTNLARLYQLCHAACVGVPRGKRPRTANSWEQCRRTAGEGETAVALLWLPVRRYAGGGEMPGWLEREDPTTTLSLLLCERVVCDGEGEAFYALYGEDLKVEDGYILSDIQAEDRGIGWWALGIFICVIVCSVCVAVIAFFLPNRLCGDSMARL